MLWLNTFTAGFMAVSAISLVNPVNGGEFFELVGTDFRILEVE
jgi:hypothetical protein